MPDLLAPFKIDELLLFRKNQLGNQGPEIEFLDSIHESLAQARKNGVTKLAVYPNEEVIKNLVASILNWINIIQTEQPNPDEFIQLIMRVNDTLKKLNKSFGKVKRFLNQAFIDELTTSLLNAEIMLKLKNPQADISDIDIDHYKKNDAFLRELVNTHPEVAFELFLTDPELFTTLNPITRIPDTFGKFLRDHPALCMNMLKKDPPIFPEFVILHLLSTDPEWIESLIAIAPEHVKQVLQDHRLSLIPAILDPSRENSVAVKEFMQQFQLKTTGNILADLRAQIPGSDFNTALEKIRAVNDANTNTATPLREHQERLKNFYDLINTRPFNYAAFQEKYPQIENVQRLCKDLDLKESSDLGKLNTGGVIFKHLKWPSESKAIKILNNKKVTAAYNSKKNDLENQLAAFTSLDSQIQLTQQLQQQVNTLDKSMTELSIDDWIASLKDFQKALATTDELPLRKAIQHAEILAGAIAKYQTEIEKLIAIEQSIEQLARLGIDVGELTAALNTYTKAVYQQIKVLEGDRSDFISANNKELIEHIKGLVEKQKNNSDEQISNLRTLWEEHTQYNIADKAIADKKTSDNTLIEKTNRFVSNAGGFFHKILMTFSSCYKSTFNQLKAAVDAHKVAAAPEQCAMKIREIINVLPDNKKFKSVTKALRDAAGDEQTTDIKPSM